MVRGREVTPSELRLHREQDMIVNAAQSERSFTYDEFESAWPPLLPQASLKLQKSKSLQIHPESKASDHNTTSAAYLSVLNLAAIRTDIAARMSSWHSHATKSRTISEGSSFPHDEDLRWLRTTRQFVSASDVGIDKSALLLKTQLIALLDSQVLMLNDLKTKWEQRGPSITAMGDHVPTIFAWPVPAIAAIAIFIATLESVFHLPRKCLAFVLEFIKLLADHILPTGGTAETERFKHAFADLPKDPRTILKKVGSGPSPIIYASCPTCGTLAAPSPDAQGRLRVYPRTCIKLRGLRGKEVPCGAELLMDSRSGENSEGVPIAPFAYSRVSDAISRYLQDPTLLTAMFDASAKLQDHATNESASRTTFYDIMEGTSLRRLPKDFLEASGTLRLVFSLSVDWFHPRGASKRARGGIGLISLACLNLPPQVRFSPENLHLVGVLPGPRETVIQPYLVPLVHELLELWTGQTFLSGVDPVDKIICVRAALVPVVCDMPAARKVAAFVGPSPLAKMACPYCKCEYPALSDTDMIQGIWELRTRSEWMEHACNYRDSLKVGERKKLRATHGIMWSELLRLPYWDPTRFLVVDAMHNLLLGLIKFHIRNVWGIIEADKKTKKRVPQRTSKRSSGAVTASQREKVAKLREGLRKAERWLAEDPDHCEDKLGRALLDVLQIMCQVRKLSVAPSNRSRVLKKDYIGALVHWAKARPAQSVDRPPISPMQGTNTPPPEPAGTSASGHKLCKLNAQELENLRDLIPQTSMPGWLGRVAQDFGSGSHGTPKADEWRNAGTVQLPMALILMWSGTAKQAELDWFLELVTAIQLAVRRSTSKSRAADYLTHLRKYLMGLVERGYRLRPNHHAALHLGDFLCEFGPVRGWWAFSTERQVGLLQKIGTSNKFGEMEGTISQAYHRAARLRALLNRNQTSDPFLIKTLNLARSAFRESPRGSHVTDSAMGLADPIEMVGKVDIKHKKVQPLLHEEYEHLKALLSGGESAIPTFISPKAQFLKSIQHRGVGFAPDHWSYDNSNVIFRTADGIAIPGRIINMFLHERRNRADGRVREVFVSVKPYILAEAAEQVAVGNLHPSFGARICHEALDDRLQILRLSSVLFHFASLSYIPPTTSAAQPETNKRMLVWPLDRE